MQAVTNILPRPSRRGALLRIAACLLLGLALAGCGSHKPPPPEPPAKVSKNKAVEIARGQIGTPYKAAGESPKTGFDCSGLVRWTYAQTGVSLPRKSLDQYHVGKSVPQKSLAPGDLVFFQLNPKRRSSYHVGIYAGGGEFIHSPSSGGKVREERLNDPYWAATYLGAKRVTE